MPRRSASNTSNVSSQYSPSIHEKKIPSMPVISQRPSFLQTMKEGLALGIGSSIGHRIVSAASGEPTLRVGMISQAEKPSPTFSDNKKEEYEQCMKKYDDITACKRILEKE